jgi:DNA polymerase/3'-5' exonuclease PolX
MGICVAPDGGIHRRIDIRLWPSDQVYLDLTAIHSHRQFVAGLLYFTGSDETNKNMRRRGIETGFHLNEYGIWSALFHGVVSHSLQSRW